jgi:hypothetical protein
MFRNSIIVCLDRLLHQHELAGDLIKKAELQQWNLIHRVHIIQEGCTYRHNVGAVCRNYLRFQTAGTARGGNDEVAASLTGGWICAGGVATAALHPTKTEPTNGRSPPTAGGVGSVPSPATELWTEAANTAARAGPSTEGGEGMRLLGPPPTTTRAPSGRQTLMHSCPSVKQLTTKAWAPSTESATGGAILLPPAEPVGSGLEERPRFLIDQHSNSRSDISGAAATCLYGLRAFLACSEVLRRRRTVLRGGGWLWEIHWGK